MRRLHSRSGRLEAGAFLAEGPQAVREAVAADEGVRTLFVTPSGRSRYPELVERAAAAGAGLVDVTDEVLEAIAETDAPQGLVAECALRLAEPAQALVAARSSVALEAVSDPGNAGTVIRTADAVGASGVLLTAGSVDPHNGKCVRSTAGSLFHLPVVSGISLGDLRESASAAGLVIVAATGDAEADLYEWLADAPRGVCWLFGAEAHGLSSEAREIADVLVRIPMAGRAESLNVATAAAVCLYADAYGRHDRLASS